MVTRLNISFDSDLLEQISSEFDLRAPNRQALRQLIFTLDGDYDPKVMQVLNLATGVGKTYLMAAFVEYLRRQGVGNVMIVTPGKTVQAKTIQNFTPGSPRYIKGSAVPPEVVTPQDYSAWVARQNGAAQLASGSGTPMLAFIFNIQQLIAPKSEEGDTQGATQDAMRRRPRRFDENAGVLFDYLKGLDDLVVIADESHLYGASAIAFNAALKELDPAAAIGLTASVNKKTDHVIYEYPLYRAIQDRYVKAPVLAFRKTGYGTDQASEEQQLRDALQLRELKQAYYDSYATTQNRTHLNAVLFVVCTDVEHANQVAGLLRTPEFFGSDQAVLQVDSKHDDDQTTRRLDQLDSPESNVLAVVSVNKLKEGWDVKNIAVIVTLRAMASEVLTQQTMGRGLRLPFGTYTDVWQIDQLDIIAHQSFTELLEAENVLQQFGLDQAVAATDKAKVEEAIRQAGINPETGNTITVASGGEGYPADASSFVSPSETVPGPYSGGEGIGGQPGAMVPSGAGVPGGETGAGPVSPSVGVRAISDTVSDNKLEVVWIKPNPQFDEVSYQFPVTEMQIQQPPIDLSQISETEIEQAASRVTSSGDVLLRKEIIADPEKKLRVANRESARVDSLPIDSADAQKDLVKAVVSLASVPKTEQNGRYISSFLVPKFMRSVTFSQWNAKSLASACNELAGLINNHITELLRTTREIPTIHPKPMPGSEYTLPLGKQIHDQIEDRDEFVRGRFYDGWTKSLFAAESFDSFTGEYQLARLLDISPGIKWWHRLHPHDDAYVYYNAKDRYFPDFVAMDTDGVYWIIEGKSKLGRHDERVQAKRKAAEALVRRLVAEDAYAGQKWGYLIAYEQDIDRDGSWEDLKTLAHPVSNVP